MPNRILREGIVSSERVCSLSWVEEVFYRRLHSVVDDYGRFFAKPALLRAACYPLQLDKTSDSDITKWLAASQGAGLVRVYSVGWKDYLELSDFRQQVRAKASKFPEPPADDAQLHSKRTAHAPVVEVGGGVVIEGEKPVAGQLPGVPSPEKNGKDHSAAILKKNATEILIFLNEKARRNYKVNETNLDLIAARLKEGATVDDCRAVIAKKCREWGPDEKMHHYLQPGTLFAKKNFWSKYHGELGAA